MNYWIGTLEANEHEYSVSYYFSISLSTHAVPKCFDNCRSTLYSQSRNKLTWINESIGLPVRHSSSRVKQSKSGGSSPPASCILQTCSHTIGLFLNPGGAWPRDVEEEGVIIRSFPVKVPILVCIIPEYHPCVGTTIVAYRPRALPWSSTCQLFSTFPVYDSGSRRMQLGLKS